MPKSPDDKVVGYMRRAGVLRPRELDGLGVSRIYLQRLCNRGIVERVGRGLYVLADADVTEHHSFAAACKRVPHGVVCLLSALRFHGLTTQLPSEVWIAIDQSARRPRVQQPRIRVVRFSGAALSEGVETIRIENVPVRVYNAAKTVADCFKYRNKIGRDVALEALRDCRRQRKATNDELWHFAKICRVANVMRPYLEAVQ
jgi:predicted transcriptional regulator of viral defense system